MTDVELERFIESRKQILARRRRWMKTSLATVVLFFAVATGVFAWFSSHGSGTASASVATIDAVSVTATNPSTGVGHVSWNQVKLNPDNATGDALVKYTVERKVQGAPDSSYAFVCGTGTTPKAFNVLSCDDTVSTTGDYTYRVVAHLNSWSSTGTADVHVVATSVSGLTPTSGAVGSTASINAAGFAHGAPLTVTVGGTAASITSGGTTDGSGNSTVSFTIPAKPAGSYAVVVSDGTSTATSATNFTITASATGLSPTTGAVGSSATINADGFIASHALTVTVGGTSVSITGGGTTGGSGSSAVSFTIPAKPAGSYSVVVSDGTKTATSATNFTITASAAGLSPASGAVGSSATINASGFTASHALTVTVGGTSASVTAGGTSGANGSSTVTFTIPAKPAGTYALVVSDGTNSATSGTNFTVTSAVSGLSPTSGTVGSSASINATGFAASTPLTVKVGGRSASITSGGTTGANGSAAISFTIPFAPNGPQSVVVSDGTSTITSATNFSIVASATALSPASGPVGTTGVTIVGSGFVASHALTVTVGGNAATITNGGTSDANGASTITFTTPAAANGARQVVVSDGTHTATSATNFTIAASATNLNPTSGAVGSSVTIVANGFTATHALTVKVGGTTATVTAGGTSDGNGSSTVTCTIPALPNGPQSVVVSDGTNSATSGTNFSIVASATTLNPTSGAVGSSATIVANGFVASHALTVTVGGRSTTITGGASSGTNGSSSITFTIPAAPNGPQSVVVSDGSNSATPPTNFSITAALAGLNPTTGNVGSSASINAAGFNAGTSLTVTVGGHAATVTGGGTTDANGSTTVSFSIPAAPHGAQTVSVSDGTNTANDGSFTVTQSVSNLAPTSGDVGTTGVSINASGFTASHALTVTVGGVGATITSGGTSDANGSSTIAFTIPTVPGGARAVVVSDSTNSATSGTNFTVIANITLTPSSGAAGTTDSISGTGFGASKTISATFGGTAVTLSPTTTTATGTFTATYTVPSQATGTHTVTVTDNSTPALNDSATYTIHTFAFVVTAPTTATAGNSINISITAQLDGATDASFNGTKTITFTGPGNAPGGTTPTSPASVSFTNGVANTVPITLVNAETVKVTASENSSGNTYSGQSANIAVAAGAPAGLTFTSATNKGGAVTITCTGAVGSVSFSCTNSNASSGNGRSDSAKVSLIDEFQNLALNKTGSTITVSLSSTGGGAISPTTLSILNNATTSSTAFTQPLSNGSSSATITATANIPGSVTAQWVSN